MNRGVSLGGEQSGPVGIDAGAMERADQRHEQVRPDHGPVIEHHVIAGRHADEQVLGELVERVVGGIGVGEHERPVLGMVGHEELLAGEVYALPERTGNTSNSSW